MAKLASAGGKLSVLAKTSTGVAGQEEVLASLVNLFTLVTSFYRLEIIFSSMLPPPKKVCRVWEGFQCGFCGAEFKTKSELVSHQFSKHGNHMAEGPIDDTGTT